MGFVEYNENTGLIVKTKANILNDLMDISKRAYGNSFAVIPGTEMYTLLDMLSAQLAETGAAAKAVYDAFGFTSATGTPLDVLCSLAGIARKEGESDNALRARYFVYLYSKTVGTVECLKTKLLEHTFVKTYDDNTSKIFSTLSEVCVTNNTTSKSEDFLSTDDLKGHSVAVVCKYSEELPELTDLENVQIGQELSKIINDYKSLGCGVYQQKKTINSEEYIFNYCKAEPLDTRVNITISTIFAPNTQVEKKNSIANYVKQNIYDYINSRKLAEDLLYSGFSSCVYKAYTQLGYEDYTFELSSLSVNDTPIAQGEYVSIKPNQYSHIDINKITVTVQ